MSGLTHLYIAGSCDPGNGEGAWASISLQDPYFFEQRTRVKHRTTSWSLMIMAIADAIFEPSVSSEVILRADPRCYWFKDAVTRWLSKWKQNGWRCFDHRKGWPPVWHRHLWVQLDEAMQRVNVTVCKGQSADTRRFQALVRDVGGNTLAGGSGTKIMVLDRF